MVKEFDFNISYIVNGKEYTTQSLSCDHFEIKLSQKEEIFKAVIYPKHTLSNVHIYMTCAQEISKESRIFVNGYQSWTDTKEFFVDEKMHKTNSLAALFLPTLKNYGDENFLTYDRTKGVFHGYTYGYIRHYNKVYLYGSMTEKNGFTIFKFNANKNQVEITKDLDGVEINTSYEIFNIGLFEGEYDEVFDRYFNLQCLPPLKIKKAIGYTSWYNYYTKVKKTDIDQDLASFKNTNTKIDFFQIDDGYETAVGDWLSVKDDFKDMKAITKSIHDIQAKAGLWLAPFACIRDSKVFKEHQDWLLKDNNGKLVKGGLNWAKDGFYILDILNPDVKDYLKDVFTTVLYKWNFDMVKLDFLYATCIIPRQNKSRGEIMIEAMDFLRALAGNKFILGCGVPLGAAFGRVDFCRIGCDVDLSWKENGIMKQLHRERVSTINTLNNTIFRRHLNGRAFVNDPDVFFLRDYNIKLNKEQRTIVANVNKLCGSLLFISDNISTYSSKTLRLLKDLFKDEDIEILDAEYITKSIISIEYLINGIRENFSFDIQTGQIVSE